MDSFEIFTWILIFFIGCIALRVLMVAVGILQVAWEGIKALNEYRKENGIESLYIGAIVIFLSIAGIYYLGKWVIGA